jgi:hypothetical protein
MAAGVQSGTSNALWNYEFSIDLRPNGVGSLSIAEIADFSTLTVDDLTTSVSHTILLSALAGMMRDLAAERTALMAIRVLISSTSRRTRPIF